MKLLKWIAIIVVTLIVIIGGGLAILLNSSGLQKTIVMGQLEGKVEHVEIDYLVAGFSSMTIRGLIVDQDGTQIKLEEAQVDYSLMDALFSKEIRISKLEVSGLDVELPAAREVIPMGPGPVVIPDETTQKSPAKKPETDSDDEPESSEPPPPFEGIFGKAEVPVKLYIDGVDVKAKVAVSQNQMLTVAVTGGGIAPGKTSSIKAKGKMKDSSANAAAGVVDVDSTLEISQTDGQKLNAIVLSTVVKASGGNLQKPATITADVILKGEESGKETYTVKLTDSDNYISVDYKASFDPDAKKLVGDATFKVTQRGLMPIMGDKQLPSLSVNGKANFDLSSETYAGSTMAEVSGSAGKLERINEQLTGIPDIRFQFKYDGDITAESLTATDFNLDISDSKGSSIIMAKLLQEIVIGEDSNLHDLSGKVAELSIGKFEPSWLNPALKDIELKGGALSGAATVEASKDVIKLVTSKPFSFKGLTAIQQGKEMLRNVGGMISFAGTLSETEMTFDLTNAKVTDASGSTMLSLNADVDARMEDGQPESADYTVKLAAFFDPILNQPFSTQKLAKPVELKAENIASWKANGDLRIKRLLANLTQQGGQKIADMAMLKPIEVNLNDSESLTPEKIIDGDTFRVTISSLPTEIINAFLGDLKITSGNANGQLIVSGENGNLNIKSSKAVSVTNLSVTQKGKPMLDSITATLTPNITYSENAASVDLTGLDLKSKNIPLLSGKLNAKLAPKAITPLQTAMFDFKGDLAQFLNQPVVQAYNNLAAGTFTAKGNVDFANDGKYSAEIKGNGFRVASPAGSFKTISLSASGVSKLPESITINAPLEVFGPSGKTSAKLDGWVAIRSAFKEFKIDVSGDTIFTDDLQLLASAFKNPRITGQAPSTPTATKPTVASRPSQQPRHVQGSGKVTPDQEPPWKDFRGTATLKLNRVMKGIYEVSKVNAQLKVAEKNVTLDPAEADLMGAPLKAYVYVSHVLDARPTEPYALKSTLTLSKFDVGKFLALTKPGSPAPLTGLYSIDGKLHGFAPTLQTMADEAKGEFSLKGGPGQLRALAAAGKNASATAGLGAAAIGIAGAFLGDKVRELPALGQLIQLLQSIDYQTLEIKATRGKSLNINLDPFLLQGPQVRLNGKGTITHKTAVPIAEQPLVVNVSLDAKDKTANLLNELRLLKSKQPDKSGYYVGPNFSIKGTPASPDFSELNDILTKAASGIIGGGFGGNLNNDSNESGSNKNSGGTKPEEAVRGLLNGLLGN
ncbi:hypothetical protein [Rubellicoccus peritrichatus]|uniref:AsmA domain-containing protein n=1 Tax=Rubellicoccus peritrichatus TaxID=3080537 RepID=A0AAQ3LBW7_9BACT|nr:hypothetical protein [Puniceicoccus sp. CR14]WOO39289.1 hypothetical protein RZN69_11755 [Puniceicoccus sp. CR14]